jgi:Flp pilus assembly protein TadG
MSLTRFLRDRRASVVPMLGLSLVPLMAGIGAAVDFSRGNAARTAMQAALDATAIMVAKEAQQSSGGQAADNAQTYFNANFNRADVKDASVTATVSQGAGGLSINLSATGSLQTQFMSAVGISTIPLSVNAGTFASNDGLGCVLALNPSASGAVTLQGSTTVNLNGCSLYDDSASTSALNVGGSASLSALSVGVVGGVSGMSGITTTQGVKTGLGGVADPYAKDSFSTAFAGCNQKNFSAKNTVTIDPGVYCGGMSFNAGANVTFNAGIYYIDGGSFTVNGGASIQGTGVTLVFTKKSGNDWPTATINGNATVNLTPPRYGATAGIVVFGDRSIPVGTVFKFNGGSSQYFGGAIYIPTGAINFSGGNGTSTSCTQIIGNTVTFVGNSAVAINCSSYGTKPFSPAVLKLIS